MKKTLLILGATILALAGCKTATQKDDAAAELLKPTLFMELPDYCPTPDGMAIAADGSLILACPNFADQSKPACLMRITPEGKIAKWIDVPVLPETGFAAPMGIAFDGAGNLYVADNQGWTGSEAGKNKGRVLKLVFDEEGNLADCITIATGMEHPNGVKLKGENLYVTQSSLSGIPSEKLTSGVYRFNLNDRDVAVTNTKADTNLLATFITVNPEVQYGLDGIVFDREGNMYVGNFGDGSIHKVILDSSGTKALSSSIWAQDTTQLKSTDGIAIDDNGNLYVADFSANAIAKVTPDGKITRIAQSPDCDGSDGGLDQPGEPIVWNGKLIVSCFDAVSDPGKVNTAHDKPYTLSCIEITE